MSDIMFMVTLLTGLMVGFVFGNIRACEKFGCIFHEGKFNPK